MSELKSQITAIDHQLSKRPITLDPAGYFIIYLDREAGLICAKHYSNIINEKGLAVDPETPITMFDHAAYLGREFTRAEYALITGEEYIQD